MQEQDIFDVHKFWHLFIHNCKDISTLKLEFKTFDCDRIHKKQKRFIVLGLFEWSVDTEYQVELYL